MSAYRRLAGSLVAVVSILAGARIAGRAQEAAVRPGPGLPAAASNTATRRPSAQMEVEGRITINGAAPADGILRFTAATTGNHWNVPLEEDGTYRIAIDGRRSDPVCVHLQRARTQSIGSVLIACETFHAGSQRFDRDLQMPPGVIRVAVPALPKWMGKDETSLIVVVTYEPSDTATVYASSSTFKATYGFQGEYFGGTYQQYVVSVQTLRDRRILTQTRVTLSPRQPVGDVTLPIAPASLQCSEGWQPAC